MPSTPRRRAISDPKRQGRDPLSELFGDFPDQLRGDRWQPSVDVFETERAIVVRAEVPGVQGDDIRVSVDGDLLRISGVRSVPAGQEIQRLHQMEIAFGPFERALRVQVPFDRNQVSAHLEDGILEVILSKRRSRQIEVETE
ncbi:MAG: Hsp20/alpha crystallin family protein [Myxococcota bacterium]